VPSGLWMPPRGKSFYDSRALWFADPVIEVAPIDPAHPAARLCLRAYFAELDRRFDAGFDPGLSLPADEDELRLPAGLMLIATRDGEPIGCGALKFHGSEPTEIKRMWVADSARGLGLGRRLLSELETHAGRHGAEVVRLETNRSLVEAIRLYRSAGYTEVARFNEEAYADHWFEKRLLEPDRPAPVIRKDPAAGSGDDHEFR